MVITVEEPSVSKMSDSLGETQRKETGCQGRNNAPMILDKAHVALDNSDYSKAGDSCRENGGTQKFLSEFTHS